MKIHTIPNEKLFQFMKLSEYDSMNDVSSLIFNRNLFHVSLCLDEHNLFLVEEDTFLFIGNDIQIALTEEQKHIVKAKLEELFYEVQEQEEEDALEQYYNDLEYWAYDLIKDDKITGN